MFRTSRGSSAREARENLAALRQYWTIAGGLSHARYARALGRLEWGTSRKFLTQVEVHLAPEKLLERLQNHSRIVLFGPRGFPKKRPMWKSTVPVVFSGAVRTRRPIHPSLFLVHPSQMQARVHFRKNAKCHRRKLCLNRAPRNRRPQK